MPLAPTEIKSLARSHSRTAIAVLVGVMRQKEAPPAARVAAAQAILDRGWGKAAQMIAGDQDAPIQHIHRIERVIVAPCIDAESPAGLLPASEPIEV